MKRLLICLLFAASVATHAQTSNAQQPNPEQNTQHKPVKVDPAYSKMANRTGGQVYVIDRSKVGDISKIVNLTARGERDALLSINTRLDGSERTFHAHVDTDVARLVVSVTGTKDFEIKRPNGPSVGKTENVVEYVELGNGAIYSIENPESGEWTLALRGAGDVALRVQGVRGKQGEGVQFDRFRFVEVGGRPGHEGMFPIQGFPLAGREADVEAQMDGEISTLHFEFRSPSGEVLNSFRLRKIEEQEYAGKVRVPDVPFVVYAVGVDMRGKRFQRMQSGQINPQTFQVKAPSLWELKAGQENTCVVEVTNHGAAGSFRASVADRRHLVRDVIPQQFELTSGASVELTIRFSDVTDPKIIGATVMVTIERADTKQTNFALVQAMVSHE